MAANLPVKPSTPEGPATTVLAVPDEPARGRTESWGLPDPAGRSGDDEGALARFREVRDAIRDKIELFMKSWTEE